MLKTKNINTLLEYNDEDSSNQILFNPLIFRDNNKLELLHQGISKEFYTSTEISEGTYTSFSQFVDYRNLPLPECGPVQFVWNVNDSYTVSSEIIIQALKMGYMPMLYVPANNTEEYQAYKTRTDSISITTPIYLPLIYYDNIDGKSYAFFDGASVVSQLASASTKKLTSDSKEASTVSVPRKVRLLFNLYQYAIVVTSTGAILTIENLPTDTIEYHDR